MAESDIDTIKRVYEAFARKDLGVVGALFDPDVEITQSASLPWGGHFKGHEGAVAFFTGLLERIDPRLTVERIYDAGEHVVETGRSIGTVNGTATPFDIPETHIWQVRKGKVTRMEIYTDVPAILTALT